MPPVNIRFLSVAIVFVLALALHVHPQTPEPFSINQSPLPAPTGFVNDYAGVIDAATKQQLEEKLKRYRDSSSPSTELAVAVVRTTGDRDIFDYSLAVARGWGIGSKADDNPSALLFIAIDDRKYFTQVSKDLEDELPDGLVGSLQRQYLVPEFRKSNYGKGISDTIDAYIRTIEQRRGGIQASPTPAARGTDEVNPSPCNFTLCAIIGIVLLFILLSRGGRGGGGGRRGGGGFGGGGSALPWIIGSILASGGGSGRSSSDWGGGSSWGGGGGFGGFGGGGDFGGGGAGGDW